MTSRSALAGMFFAQMFFAAVAVAQDAAPASQPSEFNRVSGGVVELLPKETKNLSGSFGLTTSKSALPFASGGVKGFEATLGGTIVEDRLWFFAAAEQHDARLYSGVSQLQLPDQAVSRSLDTKLTAQLGDRQNLAAFFQTGKQPFATTQGVTGVTPASFLSLHYTGIVSSNMFFNASFSQHSLKQPALLGLAAQ